MLLFIHLFIYLFIYLLLHLLETSVATPLMTTTSSDTSCYSEAAKGSKLNYLLIAVIIEGGLLVLVPMIFVAGLLAFKRRYTWSRKQPKGKGQCQQFL